MKTNLLLVSFFAAALSAWAEDVLPKRPDFKAYEPMMNRSPFAVATAILAPAATPDFAKDLYVANAARSPEGDLVTIASSTDRNFKKYLTTKEPVDGYAVSNVEWSDRVGATKVTITKDGKYATLAFNQALLQQPLANVPASPQMPVPNPNPNLVPPPGTLSPGMVRPAPIPSLPPQPFAPQPTPLTQQPAQKRTRGIIARNPQPVNAPSPAPQDSDE